MNRKELIKAYRKLHGGAQFMGYTLQSYKDEVWQALRDSKAKTVLDWGCGKGEAWGEWMRVCDLDFVYLYDPGVKGIDIPPGDNVKFDLVVCCDVLEHLLEADVDETIVRLFSHARRAVWASVCCRLAKKHFPDTDINMHVTVKPYAWWDQKFKAASSMARVPYKLVETP